MTYTTTITLGGITFNIFTARFRRVASTVKQINGGDLVLKSMPGRASQDWSASITGTFFETTRNANRDTVQGWKDNNTKVDLTDGEHNGSYYVQDITWDDNANVVHTQRRFTMEIIQDQ